MPVNVIRKKRIALNVYFFAVPASLVMFSSGCSKNTVKCPCACTIEVAYVKSVRAETLNSCPNQSPKYQGFGDTAVIVVGLARDMALRNAAAISDQRPLYYTT